MCCFSCTKKHDNIDNAIISFELIGIPINFHTGCGNLYFVNHNFSTHFQPQPDQTLFGSIHSKRHHFLIPKREFMLTGQSPFKMEVVD
jgi:hypothetical protein